MIAVIDYDTGNLCSVANALGRLGAEYRITASPDEIRGADRGICIGVQLLCQSSEEGDTACIGIFDNRVRKFDTLFAEAGILLPDATGTAAPLSDAGSCSARQADVPADATILRPAGRLKIPHMGWNSVENLRSGLFTGIDQGAYVYYVHSFAPEVNADTIATTTYGVPFSAAIRKDNFYGTQFHPEKSASIGAQILQNFLTL